MGQRFAFECIEESAYANSGWSGTLENVIEDCHLIATQGLTNDRFWAPARLNRFVIDRTIDWVDRHELISATTDLAINAYGGDSDEGQLDRLSERLFRDFDSGTAFKQPADLTSAAATLPVMSRRTAQVLTHDSQPVLLLPLCHGGFVAGVEVYLYLRQARPEQSHAIYPVRYSKLKMKDKEVFINSGEVSILQSLVIPRHAVVFAEDVSSGRSLIEARADLQRKLQYQKIGGIANIALANRYDAGFVKSFSWRHRAFRASI